MVWEQEAKIPIALMLPSVLLGGQILSFKNLFSHPFDLFTKKQRWIFQLGLTTHKIHL